MAERIGPDNCRVLYDAVHRLCNEATSKQMHLLLDPEQAWVYLISHAECWLVDGFLVCFQVGTPWYSSSKVLSELLIVRVEQGGTLRGVAEFLREQAHLAGATLIAVGTMLAPRDEALSRLYQAQGFTPEATLLTMEP